MLHGRRRWHVATDLTHEEIAARIDQRSLCLCTAFRTAAGTIWACDSTSPDALQEYAILRPTEGQHTWRQVETITTSWCKPADLILYLAEADAGDYDGASMGTVEDSQLEFAHEPCPHCL